VSFLALEAIGGSITVNYGFVNGSAAILVVGALILLTSLPIAYYAATYGVDIDLLTRGAGFGYLGSTITSLIYASFTFLFFAIEAAIMSLAFEMCFGIPLFLGYVLSSLIVIPLVTHGITFISRFQFWTQPAWIVLHLIPFCFIAATDSASFERWRISPGLPAPRDDLSTSSCSEPRRRSCFRSSRKSANRSIFCGFCRHAVRRANGLGGWPTWRQGRAGSFPAC
jgi:hypothetical protein